MRVVLFGALNGALAVSLGAVTAHLLQDRVQVANPDMLQTAVLYQLFHAAVLVAMGPMKGLVLDNLLGAAAWAFAIGIVLFSGSLYVLSFGGPEQAALVTPVGGAALILGWLILAIAAARRV